MDLDARDTTDHKGIPITTVHCTLLDLAATTRSDQLERALAQAMHLQLYDQRAIDDVIARSNGHAGTGTLARATAQEICNRPLHAPDHGECKPAFHWPAHKLIVETDGWESHRTLAACGPCCRIDAMRIAVSADERVGVADAVVTELQKRGHDVLAHGALNDDERDDWAWASEAAARDVAEGRAEQGVVCCWTGTGASIAANKVDGIRAALCGDAPTAAGARTWNDANVLALSLRATSEAELAEILDAWFAAGPSEEPGDVANVEHLADIR